MVMWKLRSCPRCGGDVFLDTDEEHKWYEQCLQCGYFRDLRRIEEFDEVLGRSRKNQTVARAGQREGQSGGVVSRGSV